MGTTPWLESARALAQGVATDNTPEANADPLRRIHLEEVARVAELHVEATTGLAVGSGGHPVTVSSVTRGVLADRLLQSWLPYIRRMVEAQQSAVPTAPDTDALPDMGLDMDPASGSGLTEILGRFAATMGPMLLGLQFGSAAGHLAQRALGQHALPIPGPAGDDLAVVPVNIAAFAADWSLAAEETDLWVCVRELTAHAVLSLPQVAARLDELLISSTLDTVAAQQGLAEQLADGRRPRSPPAAAQRPRVHVRRPADPGASATPRPS